MRGAPGASGRRHSNSPALPSPPCLRDYNKNRPGQACGSGGTTAGLALGNHLSGYGARVRAYGVCDDPDYFYRVIDGLYR